MKKNRIVVFNRLVDNKLQDLEFFETLLQDHYRKFTYGYCILANNDVIEKVQDIECECKKHELDFLVKFEENITKDLLKIIEEDSAIAFGCEKFDVELEAKKKNLVMKITKKK